MKKDEFETKFNDSYRKALAPYVETSVLSEILQQYCDANGKIAPENIAMFAFTESVKINAQILKSVLSNILEFDD